MSLQKKLGLRKIKRAFRVRNAQMSRTTKLRITVFRSLKHIYAQIIDDAASKTVASYSSKNLKNASGDKKTVAKTVGLELGKIALQQNLKDVFFDRGHYLYHGRIQALADGLREAGLSF